MILKINNDVLRKVLGHFNKFSYDNTSDYLFLQTNTNRKKLNIYKPVGNNVLVCSVGCECYDDIKYIVSQTDLLNLLNNNQTNWLELTSYEPVAGLKSDYSVVNGFIHTNTNLSLVDYQDSFWAASSNKAEFTQTVMVVGLNKKFKSVSNFILDTQHKKVLLRFIKHNSMEIIAADDDICSFSHYKMPYLCMLYYKISIDAPCNVSLTVPLDIVNFVSECTDDVIYVSFDNSLSECCIRFAVDNIIYSAIVRISQGFLTELYDYCSNYMTLASAENFYNVLYGVLSEFDRTMPYILLDGDKDGLKFIYKKKDGGIECAQLSFFDCACSFKVIFNGLAFDKILSNKYMADFLNSRIVIGVTKNFVKQDVIVMPFGLILELANGAILTVTTALSANYLSENTLRDLLTFCQFK